MRRNVGAVGRRACGGTLCLLEGDNPGSRAVHVLLACLVELDSLPVRGTQNAKRKGGQVERSIVEVAQIEARAVFQ